MEQPLTTANMSLSAAAALEKKVHSILNDVLVRYILLSNILSLALWYVRNFLIVF